MEEGDIKSWVWVLIIFNRGVHFYKDGNHIFDNISAYVNFDELIRSLKGNPEDLRARNLCSYI
jgi:hypothetical protein